MSEAVHSTVHDDRRRKLRRRAWLALAVALLLLVPLGAWAMMIRMPGHSHRGPLEPLSDAQRRLAVELRAHVERLAGDIGEREVLLHYAELSAAADYIEDELRAVDYRVARQSYTVEGETCDNLEVELPGLEKPDEIVIVGAHYDSAYGAPGANDNGTGVAALIALARRFADKRPVRTLRFVAFVNEEPGHFQTAAMGSLRYARRCRERNENVTAMLSLETIGYFSDEPGSQQYPAPFGLLYPSTGNFIGFIGNVRSGGLVRTAISTFRRHARFPSEGAAVPAGIQGVGWSDHWSFWQVGYPGIMVTDTAPFRYPHYHQASDTPDKVDYERMARVVEGLEPVVLEFCGGASPRP